MNRRGFLGGLLAAPAIVRAESLMKIWVPPKEIVLPPGRSRDISDLRITKGTRYAPNYAAQAEATRILFPAFFAQMHEEAFIRALKLPPGSGKLLTIEYE